ncbi:MAG: NAD-dependent epimerase/dehydratase family protein [Janthinobacterium lividum]
MTGGGGFIGSHLVRRLVSLGHNVTSLGSNREGAESIPGARYIYGDVSRDTLETIDFIPDTIYHLAGGSSVAASFGNLPQDFQKTVLSSVLLLDFIRRYWPQASLVYVSSAAIYGQAAHTKASHDLACLPISPYGVHKRQVESLLLDHARMFQTRSVIVRPFSVYGPGLRKQLLWDAMEKARRGVFEFFGSGAELRDWVYVSDLVECLTGASKDAGTAVPVFNAGTCRAVSVREVLQELFSAAGYERQPVFLGKPKEGDPDSLVAEDSAESSLGSLFNTPLRAGLEAYVRWYREQQQ